MNTSWSQMWESHPLPMDYESSMQTVTPICNSWEN